MWRKVIKLCILSLSCTMEEEQKDNQAYQPKKKKKTEREQRLWLVEIHDQGNLVDQKDELPGQSWHGERLVS